MNVEGMTIEQFEDWAAVEYVRLYLEEMLGAATEEEARAYLAQVRQVQSDAPNDAT